MTKGLSLRLLSFALFLGALPLAAQTATPFQRPHQNFVDASGLPCAGCFLFSYQAGTTTPQPTYTDSSGTVQNTNPIILDAAGGANIWMGATPYKFVLEDASGTTLWTVDNVPGAGSLGSCTSPNAIQAANSTGTGVTCDALITINTSAHTINVGGALPASHFTLTNNNPITSNWTLDVTSQTTAFDSISPLTTKGDLLGFGTANTRLGVGADGTILTADSTQALGFKWAAIPASGINQLTGDGTAGPGSGSQALTLATVNSSPGTCGDSTHICQVTTNGKGLVTAQSAVSIGGTDQYMTWPGCTPANSTDASCTGSITLTNAEPDTSYFPFFSLNASAGAFLSITVFGSLTTTTIPYQITCTFNCGVPTTSTIYVHAHHN